MPWRLKAYDEHSLSVQISHYEPGGEEGKEVLDEVREWRVVRNVRFPSGRWMVVFSGPQFLTDDGFLRNVETIAANAVMARWGTRDCHDLRVESVEVDARTFYLTNTSS